MLEGTRRFRNFWWKWFGVSIAAGIGVGLGFIGNINKGAGPWILVPIFGIAFFVLAVAYSFYYAGMKEMSKR